MAVKFETLPSEYDTTGVDSSVMFDCGYRRVNTKVKSGMCSKMYPVISHDIPRVGKGFNTEGKQVESRRLQIGKVAPLRNRITRSNQTACFPFPVCWIRINSIRRH